MKYKISKDTVYSELDGEICLFHSSSSEYLHVNKVGSYIWTLLEDEISKDEILNNLLNKFDVSENVCKIETDQFLKEGKRLGVFEEVPIDD
tara:strand:- start:141 stop:413 length:273 start_codon:yes stop_codon:yes gene_type:complete